MIDRAHDLPVVRQALLLRVSRSSVYSLPWPVPPARLAIMHRIDALHLEHPFAGSRMLRDLLRAEGVVIGRVAVATLMRRIGIEVVFPQMTKADVFTFRARGQDVTDRHIGVGDHHPINEKHYKFAALLEAGLGQATLHALAERLQRCREASKLALPLRIIA